MQKLNETLIKLLETEKTLKLRDKFLYTFKVASTSSKYKIKDSIEKHFKVDVVAVNTVIMPGKKRRIGKTPRFGKTATFKKAFVTLKEGQKIELKEKKEKQKIDTAKKAVKSRKPKVAASEEDIKND